MPSFVPVGVIIGIFFSAAKLAIVSVVLLISEPIKPITLLLSTNFLKAFVAST